MPPLKDISGIILAGGSGKRLGGKEKAFLEFRGRTFIQHLVDTFQGLFGRTLIVTNSPGLYRGLGVRVVRDLVPRRGALQGLITGLFYAPTQWSFVAACDTPLLRPEVITLVLDTIQEGDLVVLPHSPDGIQPFTAAYHKSCLGPLRELAAQGERSCRPLYAKVPTREIAPLRILEKDPELLSFININTPRDMEVLRAKEEG